MTFEIAEVLGMDEQGIREYCEKHGGGYATDVLFSDPDHTIGTEGLWPTGVIITPRGVMYLVCEGTTTCYAAHEVLKVGTCEVGVEFSAPDEDE